MSEGDGEGAGDSVGTRVHVGGNDAVMVGETVGTSEGEGDGISVGARVTVGAGETVGAQVARRLLSAGINAAREASKSREICRDMVTSQLVAKDEDCVQGVISPQNKIAEFRVHLESNQSARKSVHTPPP
eukprot:scaffold3236_cov66-Cylindrotheca_fusiformis.AAC.2